MTQQVTVRGFVATEPELKIFETGQLVWFRLASTERRYDREHNAWSDGPTNWFSVSCWRDLGVNVKASVSKGQPVVVSGRLRIVTVEREGQPNGTIVGVDADAVGHDLSFGTASFARRSRGPAHAPQQEAGTQDGAQAGAGEGGQGQDARPANVDDDGVVHDEQGASGTSEQRRRDWDDPAEVMGPLAAANRTDGDSSAGGSGGGASEEAADDDDEDSLAPTA